MNKQFDFISKRRMFAFISLGILLVGLLVNVIFGVEMDVTFKGGTMLKYSYKGEIDTDAAASFFTEKIGTTATVEASMSGGVQIINVYSTAVVESEQQQEIDKAVAETFKDNEMELVNANSLSPRVGGLFFIKCLLAVIIAGASLVLYVALRFRKIGGLSAALMAILMIVHDLLFVYFAFVVFRIPLNENFVAVMLTILGYSLNDTIVIYDRIRENRTRMGAKANLNEIVNLSLNQSVRRTFNTSATTLIVVVTLVVVALTQNLESIISFAVPMLFGVIAGFYSSTFICSPLWAAWMNRRALKKKK